MPVVGAAGAEDQMGVRPRRLMPPAAVGGASKPPAATARAVGTRNRDARRRGRGA